MDVIHPTEIRLVWGHDPSVSLHIHCRRPMRSDELHSLADVVRAIEEMRDIVRGPELELEEW